MGQKPLKGRIRFVKEDEGYFGLMTPMSRRLTLPGVMRLEQWK
ncbi:hypothetical protein [Rubidibacter lacunae]|nr:hypothetical protein [Rubidibacter lacunae]